MRDIKFRFWHKPSDTFIDTDNNYDYDYGVLWDGSPCKIYNDSCQKALTILDEDVILMQYTGLKDKNGKEIYEGDIVIAYNSIPETPIIKQVVWKGAKFVYEQHDKDFETRTIASENCEVIGNIYETPEKLQVA